MKIWSQLTDSTKKKYRAKGVSAQRYNAWTKSGKRTKERLAKQGVTRDEFLKAPSTKDVKRTAAERAAYNHITKLIPHARASSVKQGVESMTGAELYITVRSSADKIKRMAGRKADRIIHGREVNPFWYN